MTASDAPARRSLTRLGAVEVLYGLLLNPIPVETTLKDFYAGHLMEITANGDVGEIADITAGGIDPDSVESEFFEEIVTDSWNERGTYSALMEEVVASKHTAGRLEVLYQAIILAACHELARRADIPFRVVLNEYMNIANAYMDANESRLMNGILDALAQRLRPHEHSA